MGVPTTPDEWVTYLALRHDSEKQELETYDRYYEGQQDLAYMHPEVLREVGDRIAPVVVYWPQLVVDSVDERLDVEGFRLPGDDAEDDDLWRVWQANDLDESSQQAHIDALVMRRAYVSVGTNEDDPDTPLVTPESPLEVYADIDPRTRRVRAALKRVCEADTTGSLIISYTTLYLPNETIWWEGHREVWRDKHDLGVVSMVPLINRRRLQQATRTPTRTVNRIGRSELDAVIPLSNAVCKLATDMMVAAEFCAIPLRGIFGIKPADLADAQGNQRTAYQAIMGRLFTIGDTEAKAFEFAANRLDNFGDGVEKLAMLVASIAGLPPHYLGISTENPASADAIRSAESRLVKRAERKQRAFGGPWEQVMRLVRRFQTGDWDPKLRRLETNWRDASTPTIAQMADATVKLHAEGITTTGQAREDLRYTNAQIRRMEAEEAEEAARSASIFKLPTAVEAVDGDGEAPGGAAG